MTRCQSIPERWLIVNRRLDGKELRAVRGMPLASGVLLLVRLPPLQARALARAAAARDLTIVSEQSTSAARVHNVRELMRARLKRTRLLLISPIYPTRTHPDWSPLPRMRAAALARLAGRRAIALGGMDRERFRRVQALGFVGWAGISAWQGRQSHRVTRRKV